MDPLTWRAGWRLATAGPGGQSVMTIGLMQMPRSSVGCLVFPRTCQKFPFSLCLNACNISNFAILNILYIIHVFQIEMFR